MKTVFVTGAGRGLGLEFVRQYLAADWLVLAGVRQSSPALSELADGQPRLRIVPLDVTNHGQVAAAAAQFPDIAIDLLINNAGIMGRHGFGDGGAEEQRFGMTDYSEWQRIFATNVMGPMRMAEAFVEHVARSRRGRMVMLSSIVGSMTLNHSGGLYGYRASKAALNAIVRSMAIDLAPRGIIVAGLHPGWVRTAMGGPRAELGVAESVTGMRAVIEGLGIEEAGNVLAIDGRPLPY